MALGWRQRRLYKSTVSLYEPTVTISPTTGRPTTKAYTLAESGVKCLFVKRDSVSSPFPMGRGEVDNQFTHEAIAFDQRQIIGEGWLIVDQSVDVRGDDVLTAGDYWIVIGEPKKIPDMGGRRAGYVMVQANRHTIPHPSVA
jgi:hypothetical protein